MSQDTKSEDAYRTPKPEPCSGKPAPRRKAPKKSETLEVRIPYETKQAFLTACREDATTASEVVRGSVQSYLDRRERPQPQPEGATVLKFTDKLPQPLRRYGARIAASGLLAIGLAGFVALPSAAAPDFQAQFKKLDVNGDGAISAEEFTGRHGDADDRKVVIEAHRSPSGSQPQIDITPARANSEAFSFWLPPEIGAAGPDKAHEFKVVTNRQIRIQKDAPADGAASTRGVVELSLEDVRRQEFDAIDTDKDGKMSFQEFQIRQQAMLTRGFELLDKNADKFLTLEEYANIISPPMPKIDGLADPDRAQIMVRGGPKISPEAIKAAFARLDASKDNKLSLQEYLPPA